MTSEFNNLLEEDLAGRSLAVGQVVDGTVVQISEDGVFVDIGAKSEGRLELDQIFQEELAKLQVGSPLRVRIVKKVEGEYKLSKKSVDYEEAWARLIEDRNQDREVDVVVREKVKNGYMAVAYDILEGFIHHTNFKGRPTVGQEYKGKVLDLNRKARKLVFTRRDILKREEEESLARDYSMLQEGMVIEGVVEKLSPYGAFVKITDHLTGLLHISEFSYDHVKKPSEVLKPGDVVQVKILGIDREKNKISLSRKATLKDPLISLLPGEELDGIVESLAEFGVFVKLENGITGLVHISELSYRKFGHPSELFKPGEPIRVKILRVQLEDRRVSLSAKACERDPWEDVYSRYMVDQRLEGVVTQLLQSGAIVKLDDFFEAFVPIGEIAEERIKHPRDVLEEGKEVQGVILSIDSAKRRIRVSLRRIHERADDTRAAAPVTADVAAVRDATPTAGKVTLGDILGSKLDLTSVTQRPAEDEASEEEPAAETPSPEDAPEDAGADAELADAEPEETAGADQQAGEAPEEPEPDTAAGEVDPEQAVSEEPPAEAEDAADEEPEPEADGDADEAAPETEAATTGDAEADTEAEAETEAATTGDAEADTEAEAETEAATNGDAEAETEAAGEAEATED